MALLTWWVLAGCFLEIISTLWYVNSVKGQTSFDKVQNMFYSEVHCQQFFIKCTLSGLIRIEVLGEKGNRFHSPTRNCSSIPPTVVWCIYRNTCGLCTRKISAAKLFIISSKPLSGAETLLSKWGGGGGGADFFFGLSHMG